jgi:hypothetical protein
VNILNEQSRTVDEGLSSSSGFGRGANNSSPDLDEFFGAVEATKNGYESWTVFWMENLKGRDHFKDLGINGKMI